MKKTNKILTILAPLAVVGTIAAPIAMVSCSKEEDIYLQSNQQKTLALTDYGTEYQTEKDSLMLSIINKYAFPYEEHETHTFLLESENLKFSKPVKSGTFKLGYKADGWGYDSETKMSTTFLTNFVVSGCELEKGTEITFDLKVTFGTLDKETKKIFTKVSNTCTFKGWKLTY